jgi:hypothetical protein
VNADKLVPQTVEHDTDVIVAHIPVWQAAVSVHALPSLHGVPSVAAGFEHIPVTGLQVPTTWH